MAASLANGGLCPLSDDQVLSPAATRSMLSVMQVAGMKDYSTSFHFKVQTSSWCQSSESLLFFVISFVFFLHVVIFDVSALKVSVSHQRSLMCFNVKPVTLSFSL